MFRLTLNSDGKQKYVKLDKEDPSILVENKNSQSLGDRVLAGFVG